MLKFFRRQLVDGEGLRKLVAQLMSRSQHRRSVVRSEKILGFHPVPFSFVGTALSVAVLRYEDV